MSDSTTTIKLLKPPHPASLDEDVLLKVCEVTVGRAAGPGGQHRNKVQTAVSIEHKPTAVIGQASERREQRVNRSMAIRRLRENLAVEVRAKTHHEHHKPSELWQSRRQGKQISINPKHKDYPTLLAEGLDVIFARRFDVAGAAGVLGISMSQLAKLVRHNKKAFAQVNQGREKQGLPKLK